jgi:hypothetical protein
MKNGVFWDVTLCGSCKYDVSEEPNASFIRLTRIGELGTTQAATSNRRTLRRNTKVLTRVTRSNIPEDTILQANTCLPSQPIRVFVMILQCY